MSKKTARIIAVVLGVVGAIFIAAGPVFHFMPTNPGAYAAVVVVLVVVIALLLRKGE